MLEKNDLNEVDPEIRNLLKQLNEAGYDTWSSCQGKRSVDDILNNHHCEHSFVTFDEAPKGKLKKAIKDAGLYIYNGGLSVTAIPEDDVELTPQELFDLNKSFVEKMRKAFNLR